ncbi:MAG: type VI secretion protein IcmF/TssM N-terminal domain-containing protein [Tepidisphaerales bacterium]
MAQDMGFNEAMGGASRAAQLGMFLLAGGSVMAAIGLAVDWKTALIVGAGFVVVLLMLLLYFWILRLMKGRKAKPMEQMLLENSGASPNAISEPARRAKLDELRKSFEGGVQRFREAGKNIYSLPWYALVGEPGSGKTEAIRHSKIGFPPGLQDQLQGSGGTLNMNWWFSNNAIIIDTAGRLMFEEAPPGQTTEWKEFLALLSRCRPNCPINGLLLVIPSDSLIRDNADQLEKKAGKIARQFDNIQRLLGVRFPVFVVISKADLIVGFREFFDGVTDPHLQDQIMGWSNPNPLDMPFNPAEVQKHLESVSSALVKRRQGLMLDPVHTEDPNGRRLDQVDALYAFPESLMQIAPRLRRYLEMIFVAGEWAPKPLFLRGIYFNSAMREGSALDAALAEAMKVPLDSLPEGRAWERDRSYFLRDLFLEKVFRERGLVTRAANTRKLQRRRKLAVIITGIIAILALGGLTFWGQHELRKAVGREYNAWGSVKTGQLSAKTELAGQTRCLPLLVPDDRPAPATTSTTRPMPRLFRYAGGDAVLADKDPVKIDGEAQTRVALLASAGRYASEETKVSPIFKPISAAIGDINEKKHKAYRVLVDDAMVWPMLGATRKKMGLETAATWTPAAATALGDLVRLDTLASGLAPAQTGKVVLAGPGEAQVKVEDLFGYVLEGPDVSAFNGHKDRLQGILDSVYGTMAARKDAPGKRDPADTAGRDADHQAIQTGVQALNDHWQIEAMGGRECLRHIGDLTAALKRIRAAEKEIEINVGQAPVSMKDYDDRSQKWLKALAEYEAAQKDAEALIALIKTYGWDDGQPLRDLFDKQLKASLARGQDGIDGILRQLPDSEPAKQPKFLVDVRAALEGIKSRLAGIDAAKALAALKLQEDIDKVDAEYLRLAADADGKPLRLFAVKQAIYSRAISPILQDKIDSTKEIETVTETLAGVTAELASVKTRNDETLNKNAPFKEVLKTAIDGSSKVLDYRSAAQRQRVCESILGKLASAAAGAGPTATPPKNVLGSRVEAIAQQVEKYPPLRQDAVPFTDLKDAGRFKATYLPAAAQAVLEGWRTIEATLADDAKAGNKIIEPKPLRERMDALRPQEERYIDEYRGYWATTVPGLLVVRDFTWEEFAKSKPEAFSLLTSLLKIGNQQNAALTTVSPFATAKLKPDIDKAIDLTAKADQTSLDRFQVEVDRRLRNWCANTDPARARAAIVRLKPDKFMQDYMLVPPPNQLQPVYQAYFTQLFVKALEALGKEAQDLLQADLKKLFRDYRRFPLTVPDPGMDPLTPEQVAEARQLAKRVASAPEGAAPAAGTGSLIQDGGSTSYSDIDDKLKALYSTDINNRDKAVLQKMLRILDFLPQGEDKLKVSLLTVATDEWTKALQAGGYTKDDDKWNYVALYPLNPAGNEKDDRTVGSQLRVANENINGNSPFGDPSMPGKPFRVHLKQNPESTYLNSPCVLPAAATDRSWTGQWCALRMIFEPGAVGDGADWLVPIVTQGKDAVVIKVKFDKALPKKDEWPATK